MIRPRLNILTKRPRQAINRNPTQYFGVNEKIESKPLFLILQKKYFDQILKGTKNIEYRDNTKFYISRFIKNEKFRNYQTVIFQEGYHTDARRMTCEITKIILDDVFEIHLNQITEKNF